MSEFGDYMQQQRLQSIRNIMEKSPDLVEFYLDDGDEYYIVKECEDCKDCSDRDKDTPHTIYSVHPLDEGRFYLHRFENGGEAYSSLSEGVNGKEILLCRRKAERKMLEYFYRNQVMILTKLPEKKDNGTKNIEQNGLWQPKL